MLEKLKKLRILLFKKQYSGNNTFDQDIHDSLENLLLELALHTDYQESLKVRNILISVLEENETYSVGLLIMLLVNDLNNLVNVDKKEYSLELEYKDENVNEFSLLYKDILIDLSNKPKHRLSDSDAINLTLSESKMTEFMFFLISVIENSSNKLKYETNEIVFYHNTLFIINNLATKLNKKEYFYLTATLVIDLLNISKEYQLSRDFVEEFVFDSLKNGDTEFGYYNLLHVYHGQHSIVAALVFGVALIKKIIVKGEITTVFLYRVLTTSQKVFRDIHLHDIETNIFNFIKKNLNLNVFEKNEITFIHFMSMLKEEDHNLIKEVSLFLNTEKENLLSIRPKDNATRWLSLLYNLRLVFKEHNLSEIEDFIILFERVITEDEISYLKRSTFLDENLIEVFIDTLISVSRSRYKEDVVKEITNFLIFANRLILKSHREQNKLEFLLAMLVKSDISFHFEEKENFPNGLRVISHEIEDKTIEEKKQFFQNYERYFIENISSIGNCTVLFLVESNSKIFQVMFSDSKFSEINILNWDFERIEELFTKISTKLRFVESDFIEDQEDKLEFIRSILEKYRIHSIGTEILLIKDINLSSFPHNLLLDINGEFVSLNNPITNVLSSEWLIIENRKGIKLADLKTSFWIPVEEGDFALNSLFQKLERTCNSYEIETTTSTIPKIPIEGEINIIAAHGGVDLPNSNYVFSNGVPIGEFEKIIGEGKILILFVCHSGTMKKEIFSQKVNSFIRYFLDLGYSSIIAPYWSLNINIPPIWLPEFLEQLKNGSTVSVALFNANKKVYEVYKDPGAWACIHLFGNPYISL